MQNSERRSSRIIFFLIAGAQLLIPFGSIAFFQHRFHGPARGIGYHILIVAAGYLVLLGAAALLSSVRAVPARAARYLLPLAWGGGSVALYYIYLLAWGGRLFLGVTMTLAMAVPYVLHPSLVLGILPVPSIVFWGIVAVIPGAILLGYAAAAPSFGAVGRRLRAWMRLMSRTPLSPAGQCALLGSAVGFIAMAVTTICLWPPLLPTGAISAKGLFADPIFLSLDTALTAIPLADLGVSSDNARHDYPRPGEFQKKNVIVIVVDACRADHLGVMGYPRDTTPFLDSLQQTGHLHIVQSFCSASCCTFGGVLTLLRSQHLFNMTKRGFALQDVLKKVGYRVRFALSGDHSNFMSLKFYYGDSLDLFSDGLTPGRHFALNDDRGVSETLDGIVPFDGTPSFFYFHLMSAHLLSQRLPTFIRYQPASGKPDPVAYANNYDNGILQADASIRDLFAQLEEKGYLKNSLVVITGDHGESLGERDTYGHTHNLYAEEVSPPLMIYDPDPVTYRNLRLARQIDVAPTILDRLGLPIPSSWDGCSLLHGEPQRFSYLRIGEIYAVIDHTPDRTLKYIYDAIAKREEVYDMDHDPHDQQNIFPATDPREIQELRTAISAFSIHPGS